ncbi:peptidylprolyl isomerase [candidate division KSB1 bacterium]|nr:peptidylprolyl isomerase [candidate division KSB1 bacterium]
MKCPACGTDSIDENKLFCPSCENFLIRNNYARRAPIIARFIAYILEFVAIWFVPVLMVSIMVGGGLGATGINPVFILVMIALWFSYLIYLLLKLGKGTTPVKTLFRLRVINVKSEEIEPGETHKLRIRDTHVDFWTMFIIRELIGKIISAVPLFLGFLWALWDERRQAWHDKIAGTVVIQISKEAIEKERARKKTASGGIMIYLRENAAGILFFLLVMFVAGLVGFGQLGGGENLVETFINNLMGKGNAGIIARINGQDIRYEDFYQMVDQRYDDQSKRTGEAPEGYQLENLERQVWEEVLQAALLRQYIEKYDIKATAEEIVHEVETNPLPEVRQIEDLQTDGKFDPEKYAKYVLDGQSEQAVQILQYMENRVQGQIPFRKLDNMLRQLVRISPEELKNEYLKKNQTVKAKYIFFDPAEFQAKVVEIGDKEVAKYYKEHKQDYLQPERRRIEYVTFSTQTTAEDSAAVRKSAADLLESLRKGDDFATLATDFSEDKNTKDKGGDLGFFTRTGMPTPLTDAVFAAEPDSILGPIETHLGVHIVKVEEKKLEDGEEKVRARHILLKFKPSEKTVNDATRFARYFSDHIKDVTFEKAARAESLHVDTTNYFSDGGFIPGIGRDIKASGFIFNNYVGSTSRPYRMQNGYFVFRILDSQPEHTKQLEDVAPQIKNILSSQKRKELAAEKCKKIYSYVEQGFNLVEAADQDSLEVKETDPFNKSSFVSGGVGRDAAFIGTAFGLEAGQISKPTEGTRGWYLIEVVEKSHFDEADFDSQKDRLKMELMRQKQQQVFANWYQSLKDNAKIEDFRVNYY